MNAGLNKQQCTEGLGVARFFMVLSSFSPLFILWAIRGCSLFPDIWFSSVCIFLALIPYIILGWRISTVKRNNEIYPRVIGVSEDHRSHLLVYLFAMLLPLYSSELTTYREFFAILAALAFIIYLFWYLNLHYMNVVFAVRDYRVFTVSPLQDKSPFSGKEPFVLITRRRYLAPGEKIDAYRLSDTVYMELSS